MTRIIQLFLFIVPVLNPTSAPVQITGLDGTWTLSRMGTRVENPVLNAFLSHENTINVKLSGVELHIERNGKAATYLVGATDKAALWEGDKLILNRTIELASEKGVVTLKVKETWSTSADGNTLTILLSGLDPNDKVNHQLTYKRK